MITRKRPPLNHKHYAMRVSKVRQSNRYDTPNFYIIIGLTIFLLVEGKQKNR